MFGRTFHATLVVLIAALCGCQGLPTQPAQVSLSQGNGNRRCSEFPPRSDEAIARSIGVPVERVAALKAARSLTGTDICTMPDAAFERALSRLDHPKADHPGDWAQFRNLQRRSENGKVKPDGLLKALEHRKDVLHRHSPRKPTAEPSLSTAELSLSTAEIVPPAAGISSDQWTALGPGSVGGRIRAMVIDPTNTSTMFVGSVSGGIWKSTDAGATWNPVNDFMGNLSISSLVMAPDDHNIIYAATGEGFYNIDGVRGAGIFKSTDGGNSWSQLPATNPALDPAWYYVNRIAINPWDSNTMLAATDIGTYLSNDAGETWMLMDGERMLDIRFDPNNMFNAVGSGSFGTVISSADGGYSWMRTNVGTSDWLNRVEVAYAPSAPDTVYASSSTNSGEIWKSTDGGATWNFLSMPQHLGNQGWYSNAIWVDPTDANRLVIGGLDLWRSTDGGFTWTRISNWVNNMYNNYPHIPHADHHLIIADPLYNGSTNRKLYNGNDGGVFRSTDITVASETTGWETLNNGLAITQFYSGAGHTAAGGRIIGGTQDNGSLRRGAAEGSWHMFYGGDGGYSAVDSANDSYLYGEYVYLKLHRSTDGGTSAAYIYPGIADAGTTNANFIAPFVLDPNDNNRLLAGGASLWQSRAVKAANPSWTAIKASSGSPISAIAIAEGDSAIAWVGHNDGKLYRTSNGLAASPTWTRVGAGVLPGRMVLRILIDKHNANKVYVAYGGYDTNNLYRSTDNGVTWTNITGSLPATPIFSLARHPITAGWLYAGTEVGLFTSEDGGATWSTTNDGPANVEITDLSWMDSSTLLAATHGRGMYTLSANPPVDNTPPAIAATTPANNATGVPITTVITATFNEGMDAASFTTGTFSVSGASGTVSYNASTSTASLTHPALAYNTTYTVTITAGARDLAGNPLPANMVWTFTTMPPPPAAEAFSGGTLPSGWTVVDNAGTGAIWRFDNPGGRTNNTGGSGSFAIIDSSQAGTINVNTELRSPVMDFTGYATASLSFRTDFYHNLLDIVEVDLSTNGAAGPWTNIWRKNADYRGPRTEEIDITSLAAGNSDVMIRFHYYNANYSEWWQVDDVMVSGSIPGHARLLNPVPTAYPSLQAAYNNAADGSVIQAQAASFTEDLTLFKEMTVSLQGGFDPAYTVNNGGSTMMNGLLKVRSGTVKLENFRFR